jgi:hypothetical protein
MSRQQNGALDVLSVWREQIGQVTHNQQLRQQLLYQERELLPRFTKHYDTLKALPRHMRRRLQRQWKQSLAGVALLLALGQAPALAATINVGGACTLGRAMTSANNDASRFCTPGNGSDRIELPANSSITLTTVNNTTFGPTGLPVVRSNITIIGNHSTIRRASTAPDFRILQIGHTGELKLREMRVTGGRSNTGGGIRNDGVLQMFDSTISGNSSSFIGGGIFNAATMRVSNSTISGNTARFAGGVFSGNEPGNSLVISNTTISSNRATSDGAGVFVTNISTDSQAGIFNSTISGNSASGKGGGLYDYGVPVTLIDTIIAGNTAANGREIFNNVTGNGAVNGLRFNVVGHNGLTNAQAFVGFAPGATDITATSNGNTPTALNAIIRPTLANNGGPTRTHALVPGSPAIDLVTDGTCPPPVRDQRNVGRPQDGDADGAAICDAGSFERRPPTS